MTATTAVPATIAWPFGRPFGDGQAALVARPVVERIGLYGRPGAPLPWRHLRHPNRAGLPLVFLAVGRAGDGWLRVKVPLRPNGTTAWIRLPDVRLTQTRYQLEVAVAARRLTLRWGHRTVLDAPVAVGRPWTPTPAGDFYVESSIRRTAPDPLYGRYELGLSGFSEVLTAFNGGDGQLAVHGTGRPDLIGRAVTAGCIRLHDEDVSKLSRRVPLGTPVRIRP